MAMRTGSVQEPPIPLSLSLIDPPSGGDGVVIGVSGYDGPANIKLSVGMPNSFQPGALVYSGHTVSADGTGFSSPSCRSRPVTTAGWC